MQPPPAFKVPANVKVDLVMACTDDHGVKDATLHVMLGNENLISKNLLEGRQPQPDFKAVETLDLAQLAVKPGSKLQYWLTARDNKEPSSNRTDTAHRSSRSRTRCPPPRRKSLKKARRRTANRSIHRLPRKRRRRTRRPHPSRANPTNKTVARAHQVPRTKPTKRPRARTGNAAADTGTVDETDRKPQDGANDNQSQLTPEDQRNYEKLRQLLNNNSQQNPAGNQANPPGAQQQQNNPAPGNAGTPDRFPGHRHSRTSPKRLEFRGQQFRPASGSGYSRSSESAERSPATREYRLERPVKPGPTGKPRRQCSFPRLP